MPNDAEKNYRKWFDKGAEDELSARAVLKEGAPSTGCFLSQQMAEKYLKGLLILHEKEFPKVHDLLELETLLLDVEPMISGIHPDLQLLNRYYVETRYPADTPEFTVYECREAFEAASRVKELILRLATAAEYTGGSGLTAIIVILATAAALAAGGYWYWKSNIQAPPIPPAPVGQTQQSANPAVPDTTGWKTYRNEEYGFEVKYPEQWITQDITGLTFGERELLSIGFGTRQNDIPVAIRVYASQFDNPLFGDEFLKQGEDEVLSGDFRWTKYSLLNKYTKEKCSLVVTRKFDKFYSISSCPEVPEFSRIILNFALHF